jgi:hypothetical protein
MKTNSVSTAARTSSRCLVMAGGVSGASRRKFLLVAMVDSDRWKFVGSAKKQAFNPLTDSLGKASF